MNRSGQLDIFTAQPPEEPSRNFTIYRSSAGSGKTFTLVKEYLKIVLRNPDDYQRILAVTFTNKATDEMKSRIVDYLAQLANGVDFDMRREIEKDFAPDQTNDFDIDKRARMALDNILHNYSRFEVSTIDHFFSQLVRVLARELKMPARFDIDVDNAKAIDESLERLYSNLNQNQELLVWMEQFALNKLEGDKGWRIDFNIKELGMELFKEKFNERFSQRQIAIHDLQDFVVQLNNTRRVFIQTLKDHAARGKQFLLDRDLTPADFKQYTAAAFDRILMGRYDLTATFKGVANGEGKWYTQKAVNKGQIDEILEQGLQQIATDLLEYHSSMYRNYISSLELLKNIYSYGLLDLLHKELTGYRSDNNLMLLSDTNFILRGVINNNETPFLFEKLGARFNHILIDEFQDTSNYQWKNMLPLVINSISNNYRGVLVGDIKQSIYRWRGGNFNLLLNGVQEDLRDYPDQIEELNLKQNWRSCRNVIEFNNAFFSLAQAILQANPEIPTGSRIIGEAYSDLAQETVREAAGYVEVKFFEAEINDYNRPSRYNPRAQDYTLEVIERAVGLGYSYGDIMILIDRWDLATGLSHSLNQAGIPLVTENSLLLENSDLIRFLLNTMSWMVHPSDKIAQANMLYLYTVLCKVKVQDYNALFKLDTDFTKDMLPIEFQKRLNTIRLKPVYEMVEELIIVFKLSNQANVYLQRFQDICLEQGSRGNQNAADFLEWWDDAKSRKDKKKELSVILPPQTDAVQIKTVHQAKGLESPIVIVPFANFDLKPMPRSTFWTDKLAPQFQEYKILPVDFSDKLLDSHFDDAYREELVEELLERLNIAYVAFTRAKDQLFVMANQTKNLKIGDTAINKIILEVFGNPAFKFHANWDQGQSCLKIGTPNEKQTIQASSDIDARELSIFSSNPFSHKVIIRPESKTFFLLFDNSDKVAKIKQGLKMHAVLERIENENEIDTALNFCLGAGIIDPDEKQKIRKKIETLFELPIFKEWFSSEWTSLSERSIIDNGKVYRPDRVLVKNQEAIIIDYKREAKEKKHEVQLNQYQSLLQKMNITSIRKYLVYVSDLEVVEIK